MGGGGQNKQPAYAYENISMFRENALKILLVCGDCCLIGLQPILVHMSKDERGKFSYSPISVNFLTEVAKCVFAILLLIHQDSKRRFGEKALLSWRSVKLAASTNLLLMVPALLYAINNYLKFAMQLHFKPATVKMLGNLKVLTIALLLKVIMERRFSTIQWEALVLLILGITVNQLACASHADTLTEQPSISVTAWIYTLMSVTIPSAASVYNEMALKRNFETSVHLQNFFTYFYGAIFNMFGLLMVWMLSEGESGLKLITGGHNTVTMLLVVNNAAQGIVSSFFFKFADTILKKYSSTVATIFTGLMSAALFGHELTVNFGIGVTIVFISMHLFFSEQQKSGKGKKNAAGLEEGSRQESVSDLTAAALHERDHSARPDTQQYILPR
ncbi:hypothetical protein CYMTET_22866 [Cymbomonas tetramitiformis]|uniref:Nucleotide-sugar transporter n=1 Tax=Cymbomonas tetramitiformis TaxID=36881 RepID=A0AAE0L1H3_9CHLO|nr:hypothetical protein CYMTET_22866 [Cymbomonas tetramitiformis]